MEAAETQDTIPRPKERVQLASRERLELTVGRGGVCRLSKPVQGLTRPSLGEHYVCNPIPLRAQLVLESSSMRTGHPGQVAFFILITKKVR